MITPHRPGTIGWCGYSPIPHPFLVLDALYDAAHDYGILRLVNFTHQPSDLLTPVPLDAQDFPTVWGPGKVMPSPNCYLSFFRTDQSCRVIKVRHYVRGDEHRMSVYKYDAKGAPYEDGTDYWMNAPHRFVALSATAPKGKASERALMSRALKDAYPQRKTWIGF